MKLLTKPFSIPKTAPPFSILNKYKIADSTMAGLLWFGSSKFFVCRIVKVF